MTTNTERLAAIRRADETLARPPEVLTQEGDGANRADRRHLRKHGDPKCLRCKATALIVRASA